MGIVCYIADSTEVDAHQVDLFDEVSYGWEYRQVEIELRC